MGGNQSQVGGDQDTGAARQAKTCYYDLLQVDRQATGEEIKKAYRKRALELHPDRNLEDVENATRVFAEVQTAYEILSDPQERAWYDAHRNAILQGQTAEAAQGEAFEYDIKVTTTEEITAMFAKFNGKIVFTDSPTGFYGSLSTFFAKLADEEVAACNWTSEKAPDLPPFGQSNSDYEAAVKPFYNRWANFSTMKSFSWKDQHKYSEAPDRRIRRLMEKENKKSRDDAIRDFNFTVRTLVGSVRKRDPRVQANRQSEEARAKAQRETVKAQSARSRALNQAKLESQAVPDWCQSENIQKFEDENDSIGSDDEESEEEIVFECVICNKSFKSENQLQVHEKSKKHQKAVRVMRKVMRQEEKELQSSVNDDNEKHFDKEISEDGEESAHDTEPGSMISAKAKETLDAEGLGDLTLEERDSSPKADPESDLPTTVNVSKGKESDGERDDGELMEQNKSNIEKAVPKLGKAKAKRAKKAAKLEEQEISELERKCVVCGQSFNSKTKLFQHIRKLGHAQVPR